jgi:hypothetical protein
MAYTKLFNSIITSTLWLESDHTRLVWITMLALADKNGEVQASIPGLAKLAGVPVASCRDALKCLSDPDPDSRTKVAEGRRIVEIPGGWELINHAKYRRMASEEDARESNAKRQARHRSRNAPVTGDNASVTPDDHKQRADTEPKAEAEAEEEEDSNPEAEPNQHHNQRSEGSTPAGVARYPLRDEFEAFLSIRDLEQIINKRPDLYQTLTNCGWTDKGEPIGDWRKYVVALENHIKTTSESQGTGGGDF